MKLEDIEKTAFNRKRGQLKYLIMPMKACYVPSTFQRLVNAFFHGCMDELVMVYLDDFFYLQQGRGKPL